MPSSKVTPSGVGSLSELSNEDDDIINLFRNDHNMTVYPYLTKFVHVWSIFFESLVSLTLRPGGIEGKGIT